MLTLKTDKITLGEITIEMNSRISVALSKSSVKRKLKRLEYKRCREEEDYHLGDKQDPASFVVS